MLLCDISYFLNISQLTTRRDDKMDKFWAPFFIIFTVIFLIIGIAVSLIPIVAVGLTGKIIVEEIFKTPEPRPTPIVEIPPSDHAKLEANGIQNCEVKPHKSRYINKKIVRGNGKRFIIFCDPNSPYTSGCCYKD